MASSPKQPSLRAINSTMIPNWDPATEKALVRKIDLRIFPVMIVLFILNFIDRNNFANARLSGLEKDLKLTDVQYQTCISVLLSGYVAMQIPSNMILNKLKRPSWYLCGCVAVWGVISAATGAVRGFSSAVVCRFLLGCVEASFFPGSLLFLSRWYNRREMQLRVTILNSGNLAAQGFGGLIAAGILADMEGAAGLRAWRWLFIVEGAVTVALAGVALFILPDYPKTTSWLTEEERRVAQDRLALDEGLAGGSAEDEDVTAMQGLIMACKDVKVWLLGLAYHATIMGLSWDLHPDSSFLPGYPTPYRAQQRKKAAAIAMVNAMGNIGSIPGSYIWPAKYGPYFVESFGAEIALLGFAAIAALGLRFYLLAQNKKLDREEAMQDSVEAGAKDFVGYDGMTEVKSFRYLY
ncbi:MFS transporter prlL [Colletotrichum siamense]|nr:MFS transporter prlL [Colletotrichum siamense]